MGTGLGVAPSNGGGNCEMVQKIIVSGDPEQTQDFADTLNGDVDQQYWIEASFVNDNAGTAKYSVRINLADWAVNNQQAIFSGTSHTAARITTPEILTLGTSQEGHITVNLPKAETGISRHASVTELRNFNTSIRAEHSIVITTPIKSVNWTRLGIGSDVADGIGVGSILRLWRMI